MLITFIVSGRLVTRWGRYKVFPVRGSAIMAVGLYLFSLLTPTMLPAVPSVYMVILGLGMVYASHAGDGDRGTERGAPELSRHRHRSREVRPLMGGSIGVAAFAPSSTTASQRTSPSTCRCAESDRRHEHRPAAQPTRLPSLDDGYVLAFSNSPHVDGRAPSPCWPSPSPGCEEGPAARSPTLPATTPPWQHGLRREASL